MKLYEKKKVKAVEKREKKVTAISLKKGAAYLLLWSECLYTSQNLC
jgi:hypothetical protein